MADKEAPADAPKKGGKKKVIIIAVVALVLLLGGGGAGAWVYMSKKAAAEAEAAAAAEEEEAADEAPKKTKKKRRSDPKKMPVFVELDMFTVNLKDPEDERFMQVKLVAEVDDAATGEMMKTLMPAMRNEILLLLGSKRSAEVANREGKEKLATEIVAAANKILEGTPAEDGVQSVNFTHLIIQ